MKTLSILTAALLSTSAYASNAPEEPHIYVKGEASLTTMPDHVLLTVGITEIDKDLIAAKKQTDTTMASAISLVKKLGVDDADINAGQISIYRDNQYNRETGKQEFTGFKVSRTLTIKLSAINKYPELLQSLVNNGINEIRQTQFLASNYDELHKKAQKMAIKQAKVAAKELSDDFDVELKGLYSASLTPLDMPSTPYMRSEKVMMADSAPDNYVPDAYHAGEIIISASSYAIYYID
jgi:uncharacterized protein YggE